jgi:hypothetical protein
LDDLAEQINVPGYFQNLSVGANTPYSKHGHFDMVSTDRLQRNSVEAPCVTAASWPNPEQPSSRKAEKADSQ